jgi:light-regulated signal transduction histidine kinase (bacteriophytochrome)
MHATTQLLTEFKNELPSGRETVWLIQQAVKRIQSIVVDQLFYSNLSANQVEFIQSDINAMVKDLLIDMHEELTRKNATIAVDQLPSLSVSPPLMYMLLKNLLTNALTLSRKDVDPFIHIRSQISAAPGRDPSNVCCNISIDYHGIGPDEKETAEILAGPRLRGADYEYNNDHHAEFVLCRKIMNHHAGSITVQKKINGATTVTASFPMIDHDAIQKMDLMSA